MALTKVRAAQIIGLTGQFAPILNSLTPVSILPNQSTVVTIRGEFFTPTMTVSVANQSVNSFVFVNTQEFKITIVAGATEGNFNLTLNNGISVTFFGAVIVNLGTVYIPTAADYTRISGDGSFNTGEANIAANGIKGVYEITNPNFSIPANINFDLTWRFVKSTIDTVYEQNNRDSGISLRTADNVLQYGLFNWTVYGTDNNTLQLIFDDLTGNIKASGAWVFPYVNRLRRVNGVLTWSKDGIVHYTSNHTQTAALKIRVHLKDLDLKEIKYIVLP